MDFLSGAFWQQLIKWDKALFEKINSDGANPLFDAVMPFLRNPLHWVPVYLFVFVFVVANFKVKGIWWAVFFLITVALCDMTGTYVFKHEIERLRPCNDPDFFNHVRLLLKKCGGGYSFTSNHAANHFGMAAFFFVTFRHLLKKWAWVGFVWAFFIAYAQVYVGNHYPLDVLCGGLLGLCFGIVTGTFFNKRFGFAIFGDQPLV
ncbi:MAG: phosphatase PAP2 family protein [Ferruginibacter sp.]|nr:phosphatase PAP2 family protein [Chitinophagaceae bacterium]